MTRGDAMTTSRRGWGAALRELNRVFEPRTADLADHSDAALLSRFAATRDELAFATLVERRGPMVLATARGIVRSPDAAEDVFQATFLVLARRSGSIRSGDSVGGWLHQVTRRAALRAVADRRRRERSTGDLRAVEPAEPADLTSARAESTRLLHEELGRLPTKYRAALILCDLEALTRDQAAAQLGWPAGTVAGRLARGRQLLRDRLVRREGDGDAWLGSLLLVVPVPPAWAASAIRGAARSLGVVGPGAPLAGRIIRGMTMASVGKAVAALTLTLGLVAAGIGGRVGSAGPDPVRRTDPPRLQVPMTPLVVQPSTVPPQDPSKTEPVVFRGQVVDPAGSGVQGAKVYRVELGQSPAIPREPNALTDANGRFEFASTRFTLASGVEDQVVDGSKRGIRLLAVAPGFGPGFIRPERSGPIEIALTQDDGPIQGRVIGAGDRPVAGARIKGLELLVPPLAAGGSVSGWLARARSVNDLVEAGRVLTEQFDTALAGPDLASVVQVSATTDAEGRFTVTGLGRNRVLSVLITGPEIATQVVLLTTERVDPPVTVNPVLRRSEPGRAGFQTAVTVHGVNPTIVGRPGRTIAGVIRDADSRQPLDGIKVRLDDSVSPLSPVYLIHTVTDASGRYRLEGVRTNSRPRVSARPASDAPWLGLLRLFDVEGGAATGNPPVTLDFTLRRGVWVSGRVFDAATGQPRAAAINAFVVATNPYAFADPSIQMLGPDPVTDPQGRLFSFASGPDGRFRLRIYPGPGFITAGTSDSTDARGIGSETMSGVPRAPGDLPGFATLPEPLIPRYVGTIVAINPPLGSDTLDVALAIRTARDRSGTVLDPDGRSVSSEVMAYNLKPEGNGGEPTRGAFTVEGLVPGRLRRVLFRQDSSTRIGLLEIRGAEGPPLLVTLRPWGMIRVRIDDRTSTRNEPFLTARINDVGGDPLFRESDPSFQINRVDVTKLAPDQFEVQALEPNLGYDIIYQSYKGGPPRVIARDLRVRSGETLDLGTVRVGGSP